MLILWLVWAHPWWVGALLVVTVVPTWTCLFLWACNQHQASGLDRDVDESPGWLLDHTRPVSHRRARRNRMGRSLS